MSLLAFIIDLTLMAGCGVMVYAGAAFSYLGMGLAGRMGFWPLVFVVGLVGLTAILYFPYAAPHFFANIPRPHWWW
jgi:hypothetical protein